MVTATILLSRGSTTTSSVASSKSRTSQSVLISYSPVGRGKGNIASEQMIDEVWDYVFCRTKFTDELVSKSGISKETLEGMRRSFEYFYPLDLRVSGKDLIPNHLTFCLYNHIGTSSYPLVIDAVC